MSADPMLTEDDLAELDELVVAALAANDLSVLPVLGFGEISLALEWPADDPQFVCKRTPSFTHAQFDHYRDTVAHYLDQLRASDLRVVDTAVIPIERGDRVQAYVVQPKLDSTTIGHEVLGSDQPDPDHPFLMALADAIGVVTSQLSIDAQVTNFAFDGVEVTLIDVGTPFLWSDDGAMVLDMTPFTRMVPAPARRSVVRELTTAAERWRSPRGVALDVVANLHRQGLPEWIPPTIDAMNQRWDWPEPIHPSEARVFYEEDLATWPRLKRLQAMERWWQRSVRRRDYDFFIHSTFSSRAGS